MEFFMKRFCQKNPSKWWLQLEIQTVNSEIFWLWVWPIGLWSLNLTRVLVTYIFDYFLLQKMILRKSEPIFFQSYDSRYKWLIFNVIKNVFRIDACLELKRKWLFATSKNKHSIIKSSFSGVWSKITDDSQVFQESFLNK